MVGVGELDESPHCVLCVFLYFMLYAVYKWRRQILGVRVFSDDNGVVEGMLGPAVEGNLYLAV